MATTETELSTEAASTEATEATEAGGQAGQTALESALGQKLAKGDVGYLDLLKALKAPEMPAMMPPVPPLPSPMTDAQKAALARLPEVYGKVVPQERRKLSLEEANALIAERMVIDQVKTMVESRREAIRTTVYNHLDVEVEEAAQKSMAASGSGAWDVPPVDDKGHYIAEGEVRGQAEKRFTREVRNPTPTLDVGRLRAMADDPDCSLLTHEDYLAMTEPVRVVNEARVMAALKRNPALLAAVAEATVSGKTTTALNMRKA